MRRDRLRWLTARPIAHRGFHDLARGRPENSLAAFAAAAAAHYAIECDLHISADDVPIVFHDDDLARLVGIEACVRDVTATELGDLRIRGSGEWIPTLEEMLALVAGRVPLVIELKHMPGRDVGLAFETVSRLRDYAGPAAVMSFAPSLLAEVRALDPTLPLGLTAEGDWRTARMHWRTLRDLKLDFVSYRIDDLPTVMPLLARHLLGVPLICWTVRTAAERRKAQKWTDQMTFEGFAA